MRRALKFAPLLVLLLGCSAEDPRIPKGLLDEAEKLYVQNRYVEAKAILEQVKARWPGTDYAHDAQSQLYMIDAFIDRDVKDRQKQLRWSMKRLMDALTRYKGKKGEYPDDLRQLVPEYLEQVPETPWGHPFLYRAFVSRPIEEVAAKRGPARQKFNTKLDRYYLACLGTDLQPGGEGLGTDLLYVDGQPWAERGFPPVPDPQPAR